MERGSERRAVVVQLLSFEDLVRQKLGLTLLEVTPQAAERLGVRPGEALFIEEVEKKGPAERAQLQRGYLLAGIDGQNAAKLRTVAEALYSRKKGDTVRLAVVVPRRLGGSYVEFRQGIVEVEVR
jgi:serine protease Do